MENARAKKLGWFAATVNSSGLHALGDVSEVLGNAVRHKNATNCVPLSVMSCAHPQHVERLCVIVVVRL